jgi:EpsI family protein
MPATSLSFQFLRRRPAQVMTAVLLIQLAVIYGFSRSENTPVIAPLAAFDKVLGPWSMTQENTVEKEVMDVLQADDVLSRVYVDPASGRSLSLFIAYFKSQRAGKAPHSPKNCLPGSGWSPVESGTLTIPLASAAAPITVNRYIVSHGDERSVVLYWYQSGRRVMASEFLAKAYLVADAVRYNRSDTALVRIVVPCTPSDQPEAIRAGIRFIESLFGPLRRVLPS